MLDRLNIVGYLKGKSVISIANNFCDHHLNFNGDTSGLEDILCPL